jgi:hypothetical protein
MRERFEDVNIGGTIILKWILRKWTGVMWLWIEIRVGS